MPKIKKAEAALADAVTTNEPTGIPVKVVTATEAEPEPPVEKKSKKGGKRKPTPPADGALTLADLSERYLKHLAEGEWSGGTIASYGMEMKVAQAELGAETLVSDLTPGRVQEFFESKRVTKLRSGKAKAKPSIDKTRRVLRLALVWAVEAGLIETAPLPEHVRAK